MVEYFVSCYGEIHSCDSEVPCCIGGNKKLVYRCSIGELTEKQVRDFVKKSDINNINDFLLEKTEDILLNTVKGKNAHVEAMSRFRSAGNGLLRRLREYGFQLDCQEPESELSKNATRFARSLVKYISCMAIYYFSPVSRPFISFTSFNNTDFNDHNLIRRVLRPDRHIPSPLRRIINEFRHIIVLCQLMIDAESVRRPKDSNETSIIEKFDHSQTVNNPLNVSDKEAIDTIKENTAVLKEIKEIIPTGKTVFEPAVCADMPPQSMSTEDGPNLKTVSPTVAKPKNTIQPKPQQWIFTKNTIKTRNSWQRICLNGWVENIRQIRFEKRKSGKRISSNTRMQKTITLTYMQRLERIWPSAIKSR